MWFDAYYRKMIYVPVICIKNKTLGDLFGMMKSRVTFMNRSQRI